MLQLSLIVLRKSLRKNGQTLDRKLLIRTTMSTKSMTTITPKIISITVKATIWTTWEVAATMVVVEVR